MTEAATKTATKTLYVVLELITVPENGEGIPAFNTWREVGAHETATKNEAIKHAAGANEGTFKAVPMRSWKGAIRTAPATVITTEELDI